MIEPHQPPHTGNMTAPLDYRDSHLSPEKAPSYHRQFYEDPLRSTIWKLEQAILTQILQKFYTGRKIRHLDFACGTGRILSHLQPYADLSVGVDLSKNMLAIARKNIKQVEIIEGDITRTDCLGNRSFNLITAFRFFPNAQIELRNEVITKLVQHLDPDGYLVFNNHMNLSSILNRLYRLIRKGGKDGMTMTHVEDLIRMGGLRICATYHAGLVPSTEKRLLLPKPILYALEKSLFRFTGLGKFAQNLIFVCKQKQV